MRGLALIALGGVAAATAVALLRDPEEPWAVAVFVAGVAATAGSLATMLQLRPRRGRRRATSVARGLAIRRGMEVAAAAGILVWLRAIDGLSVVTATFVVVTFAVAEVVLSARAASSR